VSLALSPFRNIQVWRSSPFSLVFSQHWASTQCYKQ